MFFIYLFISCLFTDLSYAADMPVEAQKTRRLTHIVSDLESARGKFTEEGKRFVDFLSHEADPLQRISPSGRLEGLLSLGFDGYVQNSLTVSTDALECLRRFSFQGKTILYLFFKVLFLPDSSKEFHWWQCFVGLISHFHQPEVNLDVTEKLDCLTHLISYRPHHMGLRVEHILKKQKSCLEELQKIFSEEIGKNKAACREEEEVYQMRGISDEVTLSDIRQKYQDEEAQIRSRHRIKEEEVLGDVHQSLLENSDVQLLRETACILSSQVYFFSWVKSFRSFYKTLSLIESHIARFFDGLSIKTKEIEGVKLNSVSQIYIRERIRDIFAQIEKHEKNLSCVVFNHHLDNKCTRVLEEYFKFSYGFDLSELRNSSSQLNESVFLQILDRMRHSIFGRQRKK